MKKLIAGFLTIAFVAVCTPLYALPEPIEKIKRGAKDIISAPLEIPKYAHKGVKEATFKPKGLVMGLLKGTAQGIKKVGSGVVDIATFLVKLD